MKLSDFPDEEEDREWEERVNSNRRFHSPELRAWIARAAAGFRDRWVETPHGWVPRAKKAVTK